MNEKTLRARALKMIMEVYKKDPITFWERPDGLRSYTFYIDRKTEEQLRNEIEEMPEVYGTALQNAVGQMGLRNTFTYLYGFPTCFDARRFELERTL